MAKYDHKKIDKKWQKYWEENKIFATKDGKGKKYYVLDMFPYPSSAGLHVGHPEGYTATDIMSRYRRMKYGENVLHPMGYDAFGLPAENYAIKMRRHPQEITEENIKTFTEQLKSLGFSYDWNRMVVTSRPDYYKWTQWMFVQLYKRELAYKKEAPVNWCGSCKTVLAREQVIDGKCERCKNEVIQKNLNQWFFKITDYADELLEEIEKLDWPEPIKALQRNWIGKSVGAEVDFKIAGSKEILKVFTTRPDTLYGATFMVVAPEHDLILNFKSQISNWEEVEKYRKEAQKKSELQRTDLNKDKTGVELKGLKAVNPVNGEKIPIFVADYVMMSYGTGAVMAVPAHDERDFEFARKYNIEIKEVVRPESDNSDNGCFVGEGVAINSGEFDGLSTAEFKEKIIEWLEEKGVGEKKVQYKLRDWLISRQRYWGAPIPVIYCDKCGEVLVEEKDLPVELPDDVDFKPKGESPLAASKKFHEIKCPKCGATDGVRREVDTMDTFVCSSWYYLRYADPYNNKEPFNKEKIKKWLPVDLYVGGAEHAVLHLMYARFFTKALADAGYLGFREPFIKLRNQGMILAEDGRKMSKSLGNVINPDEVVDQYGADTLRMYEMFMGPLEDAKPWSTKGILGVNRFVEKVWKLQKKVGGENNKDLEKIIHQTIKKVTEDIEQMKFNTAISAMMILVKEMEKQNSVGKDEFGKLLQILYPFAPHLCEELWSLLGNKKSLAYEEWPEFDPELIKENETIMAVQVNGKVRDEIILPAGTAEEEIKMRALETQGAKKWMDGKKPKKVIYVKEKLVNIVV